MTKDKQINEVIDLISEVIIKYMVQEKMIQIKETDNLENIDRI
ncbi:hypothetical protein PM004_15750 [Clostridium paraputrificum]|nr:MULTISPECIES: hypothetical protein [Clostridium]MDB2090801.1 hypothetical protein [Clostridium paraputrificum]MDB2097359.1 hypothetical protein [Clostridium paraputrificum]MDU1180662.1 hypothetical protein [Clostridium sp.]MDU1228139.1 hypothetical protein [Clostridium sp.]MDU7654227.1 hypothetical protein [Clostridium sp.]